MNFSFISPSGVFLSKNVKIAKLEATRSSVDEHSPCANYPFLLLNIPWIHLLVNDISSNDSMIKL